MITIEVQDLFQEDRTVMFKSAFSPDKDLVHIVRRNHPYFSTLYWQHLSTLTADIFTKMYNQRYQNFRRIPVMSHREQIEQKFKSLKRNLDLLKASNSRDTYTRNAEKCMFGLFEIVPSPASRFHESYKNKMLKIREFLSDGNMCDVCAIEADVYRNVLPI